MRSLLLTIAFSISLLISCNQETCFNERQDGNEIGFDCGGDCVPCVPILNSTEQLIIGHWATHRWGILNQWGDTTWYSSNNDSIPWEFTPSLDLAPSLNPMYKIGYYGGDLFGWKIDEVAFQLLRFNPKNTVNLVLVTSNRILWVSDYSSPLIYEISR